VRYHECHCGETVPEWYAACPNCQSDASALPEPGRDALAGPAQGPGGQAGPATGGDREDWYYMREGHMVGPCTTEMLRISVSTGVLPEDTQVWAPGMKEWTVATEVLDLDGAAPPPPPPPPPPRSPPVYPEPDPAAAAGAAPVAAGFPGITDEPMAAGAQDPPLTNQEPFPAVQDPLEAVDPLPWDAPQAAPGMPFADTGLGVVGPLLSGNLHPWRRLLARIVDVTVAGLVVSVGLGILAPDSWFFESSFISTILVLAGWVLIEPFVLVWFENTPGKTLLNIRLRTNEGRSLKLNQAFLRSARVWFFGLAGGLPILSLFTVATAYTKLNREGITRWDREGSFVVSHGPIGTGRMVGIGLFIGVYLLLTFIAALP
jgi:hypothetical protein